jgi:multimeric flavodoxin WrbA
MILGICGSPRKSSTEFVLKKALELMKEKNFQTEFFTVRGKKIGFCVHCDYCIKNKRCILQDDMQHLYPLIEKADGSLFASPVYNGGISAQLKTVLDRNRAALVANPNLYRNKPGIIIAVGGDRSGGQELAMQQVITFLTINGALTISGGPFGANLGASFWSKDSLEGVKKDVEGFKTLKKTVEKLTNYLQTNNDCLNK